MFQPLLQLLADAADLVNNVACATCHAPVHIFLARTFVGPSHYPIVAVSPSPGDALYLPPRAPDLLRGCRAQDLINSSRLLPVVANRIHAFRGSRSE